VHLPGPAQSCSLRRPESHSRETAAGLVSGVVAYLSSVDESTEALQVPRRVAEKAKELLPSLAYPKVEGWILVIWNGITDDDI
jgi:hypothetical protein